MTAEEIRGLDEAGEGGFRRVKTRVILRDHNHEEVSAWTYGWQGSLEGKPHIPSGDWLIHTLGKSVPWFTFLALFQLLGFVVIVGMSAIDFDGFLTEFARSHEPLGWLRAGMSVVSFILLVFYLSGMVNF